MFNEGSIDLTRYRVSSLFLYENDIVDLLGSPIGRKFIMTACLVYSNEIQPAGYSDLIKEQSSEVSFNKALKRVPTTHAYPLSSISGASGGDL